MILVGRTMEISVCYMVGFFFAIIFGGSIKFQIKVQINRVLNFVANPTITIELGVPSHYRFPIHIFTQSKCIQQMLLPHIFATIRDRCYYFVLISVYFINELLNSLHVR